ncbi:HIT-like protein [Athelia psychrophila]|uniref:HIT-like protein n=1 Tax=Athelia psychrophila TaxID=1759441 RepID=A0A166JE25_9AGAM|nr:HIT-like protein [Fibularhizoctonia sp. CBS 109695]
MSNLTILRSYAQKAHPETLPPSVLLGFSDKTLTIFDAYPKSVFHFLILPRIRPPLTVFDLASLRTLLKADKAHARSVLDALSEEAEKTKRLIREEMGKRYGYEWDIWTGFHAVPSMEHLHLHVLSADLCSPSMRHKKHYNSFHPTRGFFLPLEDVRGWFDAEPSYLETMRELKKSAYEPLLKEDLACWRCGAAMKNMPTLKAHLQEEWEKEEKAQKAKLQRKRKREEVPEDAAEKKSRLSTAALPCGESDTV